MTDLRIFHSILVAEGLVDELDDATSQSFARICVELERQDELVGEINAGIAELQAQIAKMGGRRAS
jgi:hypothetical protein